jgi:hypothetical protein
MKTCLFFILSFRGVKKQQPIKKIKKIKNTELVEKTEENDLKTIVLEPARSKAHVVLVKKNKSQRVATGFLTESCRVTPGFFFSCFFFNPARFQPLVDPSGRVGF